MLIKTIVLLTIIKITTTSLPNYDDDIRIPMPSAIFKSVIFDESSLPFTKTINNCTCRWNIDEMIMCSGNLCKHFPTTIKTTVLYFRIKLTSITKIERDDFLGLSHLEILEIEANNELVKLEPGCFRNMNHLRNLSISSNLLLTSLEENLFEGLHKVEYICLAKNGFINVLDLTKALSPKYVPDLQILEIYENAFSFVKKNDFQPMNGSKLEQLNMFLCQIEHMDSDCLTPLKHLKNLRLGENVFNVSTIKHLLQRLIELNTPLDILNLFEIGLRRIMPFTLLEAIGKSNITYLGLARNHFDFLDDQSFPFMPNLTDLDLRECFISDISSNAFKNLTNLDALELEGNKIVILDFKLSLPKLKYLGLSGNCNTGPYFYIPNASFQNVSLENLQLSYNYLSTIRKQTFEFLSDLIKLNLKNTSLHRIENRAFFNVPKLLLLNLINNPLLGPSLIAESFYGLKSLNILLLGGCQIQNLTTQPGLFTHTKNLTYLSLERNGLFTISTNQLQHLNSLIILRISENKLIPWSEPILPHTNLTYCVAHQNKFTYVTTAMLEDWRNLDELNLDGNPLSCDCSLYSILVWLRGNSMHIKSIESDDFIARCVSPEKWRRKSIVDYLGSQEILDCADFYTLHKIVLLTTLIILILITILITLLSYIYRWYLRYWLFLWRLSFRKHNFWTQNESKLPNNSNYKYDAFVSYCNEDRKFVTELINNLENYEPYLKLCIYERDFQIGSTISDSILHSVAVSKRTLLVISNAFAKSHWCRWETQLAEYHQIFFQNDNKERPDDTLLMIKLEELSKAYVTPTLKYLLKTRIYLQWDSDIKKSKIFWDKLRITIASSKGQIDLNNLIN